MDVRLQLQELAAPPIVAASSTATSASSLDHARTGYTVFIIDSTAFAYVPNLRKVGLEVVGGWTPAQMADQMQADFVHTYSIVTRRYTPTRLTPTYA